MTKLRLLPFLAAVALVFAGCILTSGQIQLAFELPSLTASTATGIAGETVDLSDDEDYQDHKEDLQSVSDLAVLGEFTNTGVAPIDVEVWLTPDETNYLTVAQLNADPDKVKLWGPFAVAAGETRRVDWDDSAALFTTAGKAALLSEAKGDGMFTVYAIGQAGTYSFTVQDGLLVLEIDVGI